MHSSTFALIPAENDDLNSQAVLSTVQIGAFLWFYTMKYNSILFTALFTDYTWFSLSWHYFLILSQCCNRLSMLEISCSKVALPSCGRGGRLTVKGLHECRISTALIFGVQSLHKDTLSAQQGSGESRKWSISNINDSEAAGGGEKYFFSGRRFDEID